MKSKLKTVLNVGNNYYIAGGDARYMFFLESALKAIDIDVIPFAPKHSRNSETEFSNYFPNAIDIKNASYKDFPRFLFNQDAKDSLSELISHNEIQIAHLHNYYGRLTTSILAPLVKNNIPIIQTLHDYKLLCPIYSMTRHGKVCESCKGKYFWKCTIHRCNRKSLLRSVSSTIEAYFSKFNGNIRKVDHFISSSHFLKNKMESYGVATGKISVLHNFVNVNHFKQSFVEGNYFVYFGRVEKLKGMFTLIYAFEELNDIPLYIIGEGEAMEEISCYIASKSIKNIWLLGYKKGKELHSYVENARAVIIPSEWYENCPLSVLEAFAIGKPIIGSNIGGIPELINHEEDGYIFEAGNYKELKHYVLKLSTDSKLSIAMGKKGFHKIKSHFNPEIHLTQLLKIYSNYL